MSCNDPTSSNLDWERAFLAFETPAEAREKMKRRLRRFGCDQWGRDARIVDLFSGRGYGLDALVDLGFANVEGMDMSATLMEGYRGPARCHVGDCRSLPFEDSSRHVAIVHGGLHHLESIEDLDQVLGEIRRVLVPDGRFCAVEPWRTPFLSLIRAAACNPLLRRMSRKLDAFQTMVENEIDTYERWLSSPGPVRARLEAHFLPCRFAVRLGFLTFVGRPRP